MVQDISTGMSQGIAYFDDVEGTRGKKLECVLTDVCLLLGNAADLTDNKADMEFLLSIVASYNIAKREGKLDENVIEPGQLFDERLFNILDNAEEIKTEEIEYEGEK